ncbi:MAG TPA: PAS domain-containing protein [bacterium]|nr:PAS domain-containing protein [bacterium]
MRKAAQRKSVNWQNFWKVMLFFIGFHALFSFLAGVIIWVKPFTPDLGSPEAEWRKDGIALAQRIESNHVYRWNGILQALSDSLNRLPSDQWQRLIEHWHGQHPNVFSVTVHSVELRWPVHQIDSDFWEYSEVQNLSAASRQKLFDYLLQRPDEIFPPRTQTLWISSVLSTRILGYPIVTLHYKRENDTKNFSLQIRFSDIQTQINRLAPEGLEFALIDMAGDTVSHSAGFSPGINRATTEDRVFTMPIDFSLLPWQLMVQKEIGHEGVTDFTFLIPFGATVYLIGLILSVLMVTRWIDRPMQPLYDAAFQMSRGNFSIRVPELKNEKTNRIGRIINYMAEEMDHIQQMNVSRIIIEKNKTETILRNIADGVIVTDNIDQILVINPVAERWFDLRETGVRNEPVAEHIKAKLLVSLIKEVRVSQEATSIDFHLRVIETDEQKVFHAHAAPVTTEEDRHIGVVTIIRDVTEQREIERMKTELVSMVAHELKSPLTSICGFSELLLGTGLDNPKSHEYAHVILEESNRLTDLVNKFLDLSRLESGRTEPNIEPFDLRESITRLLEAHTQLAKSRQIRVITEFPGHLSDALGDAAMIDQVLINLFSNAIKYSPDGAKVGIEIKEEETELIVNFIDNGCGIPKEELPRIFEKFYRVRTQEETDRPEGSGLGLSLVKQIIERHHGVVRVKSQPGIGSIFSFTLPKKV